MITLTHVGKLLRVSAPRLLVVGLMLAIGSGPARAQTASHTLIAPQRPGDRLVLWGAFDISHRPILEFTQLVRRGETPRAPAGYPVFTDRVDGSMILRLDHSRRLKGSWARAPRVELIIPAGTRKAGWGWIATVPYAPGASGYTLFKGRRSLGGETFPHSPDQDPSRATLNHLMSSDNAPSPDDTFVEGDRGDGDIVVDGNGKPVNVDRLSWSINSPHGQPPHGAWMSVLPQDSVKPHALLRRGAVQVAWPSNRGHNQLAQASVQVHEWEAASEWWFCFKINVPRPVAYPWRSSVVLRRSFGLQVLEEILPLDMETEPPLEADNP